MHIWVLNVTGTREGLRKCDIMTGKKWTNTIVLNLSVYQCSSSEVDPSDPSDEVMVLSTSGTSIASSSSRSSSSPSVSASLWLSLIFSAGSKDLRISKGMGV